MVNHKSGKWGQNLHFQENQIDYLWFCCELIFLVFWFLRFLCKFMIYGEQGTDQFCCKSDLNWLLLIKTTTTTKVLTLYRSNWSHLTDNFQEIAFGLFWGFGLMSSSFLALKHAQKASKYGKWVFFCGMHPIKTDFQDFYHKEIILLIKTQFLNIRGPHAGP